MATAWVHEGLVECVLAMMWPRRWRSRRLVLPPIPAGCCASTSTIGHIQQGRAEPNQRSGPSESGRQAAGLTGGDVTGQRLVGPGRPSQGAKRPG